MKTPRPSRRKGAVTRGSGTLVPLLRALRAARVPVSQYILIGRERIRIPVGVAWRPLFDVMDAIAERQDRDDLALGRRIRAAMQAKRAARTRQTQQAHAERNTTLERIVKDQLAKCKRQRQTPTASMLAVHLWTRADEYREQYGIELLSVGRLRLAIAPILKRLQKPGTSTQ